MGLALITPLVGALLIWICRVDADLRESMSVLAAIVLILLVCSLFPTVASGERPHLQILEILPGLSLAFELEPLGMLFAAVASILWLVTTIYAIGYMRGHAEKNQTRFYICFAVSLASTIGIAFSGNMFTLFVFYEALTIATYPLVTHAGGEAAKRAGRVYLGILLGTSILFQLLAILWTWGIAGHLDFVPGGILRDQAPPTVIAILFALYVFGVGKAALMPFHRWLPAAMVAPTPVSALLHAVAVVKAGVFTILKISLYIFGIDLLADLGVSQWITYVAAATILVASLVAMTKDNLKARLAYSTISQLSYVVLGATLANSFAVVGGALHVAMHAVAKITLFFCAGAILVASHKTEVSQMRGLGRAMPFTMTAFLIGSLSVIGLPPFGGIWSKWYLALGTLAAGELLVLAALVISSLLNVAYLLPIPIRAFFAPPSGDSKTTEIREAPLACMIAITVTAFACLALFFYPQPLYQLLSPVVNLDGAA